MFFAYDMRLESIRCKLGPKVGIRGPSAAAAVAVLACLLTIGASALLVWAEIRRTEHGAREQLRMLVRMIEDDVVRTADAAHAALSTVVAAIEHHVPTDDPALLGPLLAQTLVGLQNVRAISIVDLSGRILASSAADDVDKIISLDALGGPLSGSGSMLGPVARGLTLSDAGRGPEAKADSRFLPLVMRQTSSTGHDHYVVVQIDPTGLASYQRKLLQDEPRIQSTILQKDGALVASSGKFADDVQAGPPNAVTARALDGAHRGTFIQEGQERRLVAYRSLSRYPLVIVVQQPYSAIVDDALASLHWLLWSMPAVLAVIVGSTVLASRTIRQRERTRVLLRSAEGRLQDQLRLTQLLQEIAPVPLCMTDTSGRFLMVNRAWEEFMRLRRAEVLGRRNADFLPPAEAFVYDVHDARLLREGGEVHFEDSFKRADGTRRHVQVHKVAVTREDGSIVGLLAAKLDVSDFRLAQATAETASRSKSEFVANISHELRTPLQSILGFSELGLHRGAEHPRLAAMFEDIRASGIRMLELVNNLLDVSKIESTVGTFNFRAVDVRICIQTVAQELEPLFNRKRQRLDLVCGDHPIVAPIDAIRIQQVIRNVLANAIKFSPEESTITVSVELAIGLPGLHEILIAVRDQGPGVPEGENDAIFEPFVQSTRTQQIGGGTGLGLAICRKIVDAHGGSIRAHNAPERGAVFEIRLPYDDGGVRS